MHYVASRKKDSQFRSEEGEKASAPRRVSGLWCKGTKRSKRGRCSPYLVKHAIIKKATSQSQGERIRECGNREGVDEYASRVKGRGVKLSCGRLCEINEVPLKRYKKRASLGKEGKKKEDLKTNKKRRGVREILDSSARKSSGVKLRKGTRLCANLPSGYSFRIRVPRQKNAETSNTEAALPRQYRNRHREGWGKGGTPPGTAHVRGGAGKQRVEFDFPYPRRNP